MYWILTESYCTTVEPIAIGKAESDDTPIAESERACSEIVLEIVMSNRRSKFLKLTFFEFCCINPVRVHIHVFE